MRDEEIVAAARALAPRLEALLRDDAAEVGAALARLLSGYEENQSGVDDIVHLLSVNEVTRQAMRLELESSGRTDDLDTRIAFSELPGLADPVEPIFYRCAACGFTYPVFEIGEPVPQSCPDRHGPLTRAR